MARILVLSFSDLARDPRVDRQIGFLRPEHEVIAAGIGPPADPDVEFVDLRSPARPLAKERVRQAGSLARFAAHRHLSIYWGHPVNRFAIDRLSHHGCDLIIANDLPALPIACRIATRAAVIFDAHELAMDEHADQIWWRAVISPYLDALLRTYLPRTAGMMTVSQGIADVYSGRYGVEPIVVTNAPPTAMLRPTPTASPIRMIHHGLAIRQRRLEVMVEAIGLLGGRFELDLMVMPSGIRYFDRLKRLVAVQPHVRLVDPVPQREIVRRCNDYDVGVYVLPPQSKNDLYALPNKLFEFIQARLAVVVGPSPEMARVVRDNRCGVVASGFTPRALADALKGLTREQISRYKQCADNAAGLLNAERNRNTMLTLVDGVLAGQGHLAPH